MKNVMFVFSISLLLLISGCKEIKSETEIREIAYDYLNDQGKELIIDWETASVDEYPISNELKIMNNDYDITSIKNIDTYAVTFHTNVTLEAFAGPIIVYLDKNTYKILGMNLRL
ncbi:MAG: hypothetical protein K0S76_1466 [Herbinix sp.]|nr:hypothetical protein [Herbinix sp.]